MTLGELIEQLEKLPPSGIVRHGFDYAMSYRECHYQLAFKPKENARIRDMLKSAKSAINSTYEGYKGELVKMDEHTDCFIAEYGRTGELIGDTILAYWADEAFGTLVQSS